ncbi:hypothetical protein GCM10027034_35490 [Ramlibacter solisilvae]|uniref:Uncharacterized protein n=1 Tax=Ramlibacter tataouinensis TaxID=94132 RepID=A0A127JVA9_9BURK|nr:hypothetical protein UC35_14235 [Ramlibacter tataouinensis]
MLMLSVLMLAGCAGLDDRSHGSWLDSVGRPPARADIGADAAKELGAQIQQLRAQAEAIRISMAHEGDRVRRVDYLKQLEALGDQLRPLEQALRQSGISTPVKSPAQG